MDQNKLWINYEQYRKLSEYCEYLERKWWAWTFYGIHPWEYTEFEEFKSSNKQGSVSLKNSNEMAKGARDSILLCEQKGAEWIQNQADIIPSTRVEDIDLEKLSRGWISIKDWDSLCKTVKNKIRLS